MYIITNRTPDGEYTPSVTNIELPRCRASRILYVYRSPINYKELEFINLPLALF